MEKILIVDGELRYVVVVRSILDAPLQALRTTL